jgi:hypothetical protein
VKTGNWQWGLLAVFVFLAYEAGPALAHGGGIDAHGGHNHRATGTYHFHRGKLSGQSFPNKLAALAMLLRGTQEPASQVPSREGLQPSPSLLDSNFIEAAQEAAQEWTGAEVAAVSYVVGRCCTAHTKRISPWSLAVTPQSLLIRACQVPSSG